MRFAALTASLVGSVVFAVLIPYNVVFVALFALCGILSGIGIWDLLQSRHSIRRNYPILAHIRFMLEKVRPEIRQYFLESETDGRRSIDRNAPLRTSGRRARSTSGHSAPSKTSTATTSSGSIIRSFPVRSRAMTFALRSAAPTVESPMPCPFSTFLP
jgi:hypothetical protein